jgi:hypothetical protein
MPEDPGSKESIEIVRASVVEARAAAGESTVESVGTAEAAHAAQDASSASRDRDQQRIAHLRKRTDPGDAGDEAGPEMDPDTTDMNAVGDDGQVFGG